MKQSKKDLYDHRGVFSVREFVAIKQIIFS